MEVFNEILKKRHLVLVVFPLLFYLLLFSSGPQNTSKELSQDGGISVLPLALRYVKRYYVDQEVINPRTMLVNGLNRLERNLDEVLVDFPSGEDGSSVRIQVMNEERTFNFNGVDDLESAADKMEEVFRFVTPRQVSKEPKALDLEYAVADEMLKTLDPYSGIITPQVYQEFTIETEGSFGGLGIVIGIRDGHLTVIAPIEGTPAYQVGVKPNDRIVQIEDESTVNMSLIEAVGKLRGPKGTVVNIHIQREGLLEPKEFSIVRDTINIQSVEAFNLSDGVIYVKIRDFQKNTLNNLRDKIRYFRENGTLKGLVLDLRGNPGGLLDQAERISDLFLNSGVVVTTQIGDSKKPYYAQNEKYDFSGKIVVLVDSGSASASEIVAGAIKNNDRGVVLGQRTFGKGSVQQIFDLSDGSALKLTIAHYLTPGDISIQEVGITPDIGINPAVISKEVATNSFSEDDLREKSNGERPIGDKPYYSISYLESSETIGQEGEETPEEALSRKEKKEKVENDFHVAVAKDIILYSHSSSRDQMLREVKNKIRQISEDEERKIEQRWQEMGVNWSLDGSFPGTSTLSLKLEPSTVSAKAGESLNITAEVENTGSAAIYRLNATTESDHEVFNGKEFTFGKLEPGEKKKWDATFEIPKWIPNREDVVTFKFKDAYNSTFPDFKFTARIEGLPKPIFGFNYQIIDDGTYGSFGNGDGIPEVGETIALVIRLKNMGAGAAEEGIVAIKNLSGDKIFLKKGRAQFKKLNPGEINESILMFSVKKVDSSISLELQVLDEVFREGLTSKIQIREKSNRGEIKNKPQAIIVSRENAPIRGGGYSEAPVIALCKKGSIFNSIGENEGWLKVRPSENVTGWIEKQDIVPADSEFLSTTASFREVFQESPTINLTSPPLYTNSDTITIKGLIKDGDGIELVSVFVGDDKVILLPARGNEVPISLPVKLDDGVNLVTVFAKDSKNISSKAAFMVRRGV